MCIELLKWDNSIHKIIHLKQEILHIASKCGKYKYRILKEVILLALNDYLVPLNLSLKEFAQRMIQKENSDFSPGHPFSMKLFELLVEGGCDFYELLSIYSEIPKFENNEIDELMILSPAPKERYTVTRNNIRTCIPRWTSSKYSSGPISEVVESIIDSLTDFTPRVRVFNSNLNLRNKRAVNDRYILMISEKNALFMDINRRSTYSFS